MAEVFGIVAGAAGIISLLTQVINSIDILRDIQDSANKAPAELTALSTELTWLRRLIEEAPRNEDFVLQMGNASLGQVVSGLEKLKRRFATQLEGTRKSKMPKLFVFRHWKEDVKALRDSIQNLKLDLIIMHTPQTARLEELMLVSQDLISSLMASGLIGNTTSRLPQITSSQTSEQPVVIQHSVAQIHPPKRRNAWNCAERHCSCRCHSTARADRRYWALEYTPAHIFRQTCDNKSCNGTKYGVSFRFTLSQYGVPWSATLQLYVLAAQARFSLRPAFEVERIVRYTSPGFETILKYQEGFITFEEAREKFVDLHRSDPTFKNHVNPGGRSYIEELVRGPRWNPVHRADQYALLELFMCEFGMVRGIQDTRFLTRCAKWIGEGPHLELLDHLLAFGLDATVFDSPLAQNWPAPCSPNWIAEDIVDDPFFVEYLGKLLKNNQGFADMSPLHEAVLLGSDASFNKWLSSSAKDETNFLGQTPMHLATSHCERLVALIEAGHDIDATDVYGITPLMYAAASNSKDCFIALLDYGPGLNIQCKRYQRTFMQYAAVRGHWDLLFEFLCWVEQVAEEHAMENIVTESWAEILTIWYYVVYPDYLGQRTVSFQQLLTMCGSVDFLFDDDDKDLQNNTLLHYVRSVEDIEILLAHGFKHINRVNSAGQHALLTSVSNNCGPDVTRRLLDAGAEVNIKDNSHHTTLYYLLYQLQHSRSSNTWGSIDIACVLLVNGADPLCSDNCRCPCSSDGCLPSSALGIGKKKISIAVTTALTWSLEWLTLVLKYRGEREARMTALAFIRRARFEDLGMTHVCCGRHRSYFSLSPSLQENAPMPDEDIDQILEEESEFIDILQEEMTLISAKPYEALVDDWIQQNKSSLHKSCMKAKQKNKSTVVEKVISGPRTRYEVDSKRDCFIYRPSQVYTWDRDPAGSATAEIVQYIHWMQYEFQCGNTSKLDEPTRDKWYYSRISWLHRLVHELEISIAQIVNILRKSSVPEPEYLAGRPIKVEEVVKHFRASWGIWEERQSLLAGKVGRLPAG